MAKLAMIQPDASVESRRPRIVTALGKQTRGKAQPDDALVLTPTGFREIGTLAVGDLVTCPDGKVAAIDGVYPQGEKEIFQFEFHDGRMVECCDEHLWKVWVPLVQHEKGKTHSTRKAISHGRWDVVSTSWLRQTFDAWGRTAWGRERMKQFAIPLVSPMAIEMPSEDLPIPPYALGALIGDGGMSQNNISFSTADQDMVTALSSDLPDYDLVQINDYDYRFRMREGLQPSLMKNATDILNEGLEADVPYRIALYPNGKGGYTRRIKITSSGVAKIKCGEEELTIAKWAERIGISSGLLQGRLARMTTRQALGLDPKPEKSSALFASPLRLSLKKLGLHGTKSSTKFIPELYKRGSISQRLAVIRGLMDTDGCVAGNSAEFSSTSEQLARDVQYLAWSLGATAGISRRQTYCTYKGEKVAGAASFRVRICHPNISEFFSLPRKISACGDRTYNLRLRIKSITSIGKKHARCISVDHPDHLYVTNNYVVTHNTFLLKWYIERSAASRTRPLKIIDADPHNQTLARHFEALTPGSTAIEDRRVFLEQAIRDQRDAARDGQAYDVVIDLGGGDLLMERLSYEVKFTQTLEQAGIDLTCFFMIGPQISDLGYFASLNKAGFKPKHLGLVFNAGLVPGDRSPEKAFDQLLNEKLIHSLISEGAVPLFMPALASDCVAAVDELGTSTFREALSKLDMWHEMRLETWLDKTMEDQITKNLDKLGYIL